MIYELNVKNEIEGDERFYGIEVNPPVANLTEALEGAKKKTVVGINYAVGIWVNGGCYTGGEYLSLETYKRL